MNQPRILVHCLIVAAMAHWLRTLANPQLVGPTMGCGLVVLWRVSGWVSTWLLGTRALELLGHFDSLSAVCPVVDFFEESSLKVANVSLAVSGGMDQHQ